MAASKNFSLTYTVVYVSPTTYKVNVEFVTKSGSLPMTYWLLKNGTVLALNEAGQNITGAAASSAVLGFYSGFASAQAFVADQSTYSSLFHSTGTSTATIGTNTFTVTNYVANALPETIQRCNGEITTLTTYSLSVGTPSGSSLELVPYANVAGSTTINGTTTTFDFIFQTTAFTVA